MFERLRNIIVVIVLAVLALVALGCLVGPARLFVREPDTGQQSVSTSTTPPDVADAKAHWSTYVSKYLGVSFRYPGTWIVRDEFATLSDASGEGCCIVMGPAQPASRYEGMVVHNFGDGPFLRDKRAALDKLLATNMGKNEPLVDITPVFNPYGIEIFLVDYRSEAVGLDSGVAYYVFVDDPLKTKTRESYIDAPERSEAIDDILATWQTTSQ